MIDSKLNVTLFDVLELIFSAEDYGFGDDVLMATFAEWMNKELSDEDIEAYAKTFLTDEAQAEGYGEEDYNAAIHSLRNFRSEYCR